MNRRTFITLSSAAAVAPAFAAKEEKPLFEISLAQWSLHRALHGGKLDNLDWPAYTKENFGIMGLEYVNQFFKTKAKDQKYLKELNRRVDDLGMTNVLIMIDGEGHLGATSKEKRAKTVENHKKWVEAAKTLGCHSIRVNAHGDGSREEAAKKVTEGLHSLSSFAAPLGINVIVENHGGLSSDGQWLAGVLAAVNLPNCGSLPDFGNFHDYDRYQGIRELMPFAKGVSAKSRKFNEEGDEVETDFREAMKIVLDANYRGWVGVEWEGRGMSEDEGIKKTKALLETIREEMATEYAA
ncbi:MAG: sugar phosphate isomerase/epimerase family protein [Verrucomicrobiota bacterium JB023]|nr:sugar phosphate isomerase/epimerase family protein [Verrucomicrobiota bacterium JB023]